MSSLATAALPPVVVTFSDVHAVPLSIVARFGVAEPDQCSVGLQSPTILSDQLSSVPTSMLARSCTLSFHVPAAGWPLNAVMLWPLMMMLSPEPPARLLTMKLVPPGEISVTTRSPRYVCVMCSDSRSCATLPLPVTGRLDVMPVALLSGIAFGTSVAVNVLLMHVPPPPF